MGLHRAATDLWRAGAGPVLIANDLPQPPSASGRPGAPAHAVGALSLLLVFLAIVCDGFDGQLLGLLTPSIAADWRVPREAFAHVSALGIAGVALGTLVAGYLNDRLGRKPVLLACIVAFSLTTISASAARSLDQLAAIRFCSGLGLGGALVSAVAYIADSAAPSRRARLVALSAVCMPIGGALASVVVGTISQALGWRAMFVIGGVAPAVLAFVLWLLVPPVVANDAEQLRRVGDPPGGASFASGQVGDALRLCVMFFMMLFSVYMIVNWLPSLLSREGAAVGTTSAALAVYNLCGIPGGLAAAALVDRLGTRRAALLSMAPLVAGLAILAASTGAPGRSIAAVGLLTLGTTALHNLMFSMAVNAFRAESRGKGVGTAMAVGRMGAVVSAYVGAVALPMGRPVFFGLILAATAVLAVCVLTFTRHAAGSRSRSAAG